MDTHMPCSCGDEGRAKRLQVEVHSSRNGQRAARVHGFKPSPASTRSTSEKFQMAMSPLGAPDDLATPVWIPRGLGAPTLWAAATESAESPRWFRWWVLSGHLPAKAAPAPTIRRGR